MTGTANSCSTSGLSDPNRRKSQTPGQSNSIDVVGPGIEGQVISIENCEETDRSNTVCLKAKMQTSNSYFVIAYLELLLLILLL